MKLKSSEISLERYMHLIYDTTFYSEFVKQPSGVWGSNKSEDISGFTHMKFRFDKHDKIMPLSALSSPDILEPLVYNWIIKNKDQLRFVEHYLSEENNKHNELMLKEMIGAIYAKRYHYAGVVYFRQRHESLNAQDLRRHTLEELIDNLNKMIPTFDFQAFVNLEKRHDETSTITL